MIKSDAQILSDVLDRIKILAETSDGWEDGETFYVDVIRNIKEQLKEVMPVAQRLVDANKSHEVFSTRNDAPVSLDDTVRKLSLYDCGAEFDRKQLTEMCEAVMEIIGVKYE